MTQNSKTAAAANSGGPMSKSADSIIPMRGLDAGEILDLLARTYGIKREALAVATDSQVTVCGASSGVYAPLDFVVDQDSAKKAAARLLGMVGGSDRVQPSAPKKRAEKKAEPPAPARANRTRTSGSGTTAERLDHARTV